ncbi:putative alpha-amylase [Rosa chinensis]|uniref:Putative alpha-amylase n=1 Tax=Rosa chinensis TaxID=74649 RepID=A0A2P6RQ76_ROSCH|nr:putative alpha-amylase [Rosa chinensis]
MTGSSCPLCFPHIVGYLPQNIYSLNSKYGSEHQLKGLLQKIGLPPSEHIFHQIGLIYLQLTLSRVFEYSISYAAKYVKEYIEGANQFFPLGSIGILATTMVMVWTTTKLEFSSNNDKCLCCLRGLHLCRYHRQRILSWIDGTGQLSTVFDFTTKGVLQEAVKGKLWRLRDPQGKPPVVIQ